MSPVVDDTNSSPRPALRLSHAIMALLFVLIAGRLIWHVSTQVRRGESLIVPRTGVSATDARGKRVALAAPPRRIVSLTPSNTEILFALGLAGHIVADTAYCDFPPEARTLPHIGDMNISVEKVVAARPDLVVASISANSKAIPTIENAGIPIFAVDPKDIASTCDAIRSIGRITGHAQQAQKLVNGMRARQNTVRQVVARAGTHPKVLEVLQMDPLWVVGSGNFVDEIITEAGGVNIARDSGPGYHTYSPELVVARQPDVILTNPETLSRVRSQAGWANLPAMRRGAVYAIDPALLTRPGPRLADGLEEVARRLHPRAFAASR